MSLPGWAGGQVSSLKGEKAVEEKKDSIAHCRGSRMGPGQGHQGRVKGQLLHPAGLGTGHSQHARKFALVLAFAVLS